MNIIIGFILSKIFWFIKDTDYVRSPNSCAELEDWDKRND